MEDIDISSGNGIVYSHDYFDIGLLSCTPVSPDSEHVDI